MKLTSPSFRDNDFMPTEYALGGPAPDAHFTLGPNRNPTLRWHDLPAGTRSLVLICHDADAPNRHAPINQTDHILAADIPRKPFYHWVLVDIPPHLEGIRAGEFSEGLSRHAKNINSRYGTRQGLNNYTEWFQDDPEMAGSYFGYDGPCPPWNDSIPHRYVFTLYATDLERCPVEGEFRATDVLSAIEGHILATATLTGRYSLNPSVRPYP